MKLGCCIGLKDCNTDTLNNLNNMGYAYIETSIGAVSALSEGEFDAICESISKSSLKCEVCNGLFPANLRLTGEDVNDDAIRRYLDIAFARTARLGAQILVFGSSAAKNIPEGFAHDQAVRQYLNVLSILNEYSQRYDIVVVIEHLNRKEANFVTTIREAFEFMKQSDLPGIKMLIDYYHMKMEDEDESIIAELGSDLRHIHIADKDGRVFPFEASSALYREFFDKIRQIGYDARVSIEAGTKDLLTDAAMSSAVLHRLID